MKKIICLLLCLVLVTGLTATVWAEDYFIDLGQTWDSDILAGGIYAAVCHPNSFDEAMITAVNHSGRSAAVGAVTGAILGAKLGEEEIPEFYLEPLEPAEVLRDLADDVLNGCPMDKGSRLFDGDWDSKYLHGSRN